MSRYIDEVVLKEWVENWFTMNRHYHPFSKSNNIPITELYDILERVDAVEVVRCKDCKHWDTSGYGPRFGNEGFGWCEEIGEFDTHKDWYCGWGERKEQS